eukprot:gene29381-29813_t
MKLKSSLVWLRRDLRAFDHVALHQALQSIDRRVDFIHASIAEVDAELRQLGGYLITRHADPVQAIPQLAAELGVDAVFCNHDYEPQAIA